MTLPWLSCRCIESLSNQYGRCMHFAMRLEQFGTLSRVWFQGCIDAASLALIWLVSCAGFDAQYDTVPQNAVGIHHPHGNAKKISFVNGT